MLRHIPPILSPDLVKTMMEMGHGDELLLADANFPAYTNSPHVIRADGITIPALLEAVLTMMPLDTYSPWQVGLMETVEGDPRPPIWHTYNRIVSAEVERYTTRMFERFSFYEHAAHVSAVVVTGETALYGNIILKKGVL
ncbi:MAG: RbsD/FucU domain-containing protein [Actinomycetaceae bacterium]|nr:fucose isomerase [Arcanobacterium sp.]MDD7505146.1 RbsD/FucU domain-containing protein [Actinomycetaceae bacterium]MDY6143864.1 RbsD/FucU domain-containing protein [Arcanobacterium sp.]